MGIRRFPRETVKKQKEQIKSCCPTHLERWDCGCSWGCDLCWVAYSCTKCNAKYGRNIADEIRLTTSK